MWFKVSPTRGEIVSDMMQVGRSATLRRARGIGVVLGGALWVGCGPQLRPHDTSEPPSDASSTSREEEAEGGARRSGRLEGAALRRRAEQSELVAVGVIVGRVESEGNVYYDVRIQEFLAQSATARPEQVEHPYAEGETVRLSTFWFAANGGNGEIGSLREFSRYVFFLSPTEEAGVWLNLVDPARYGLPEAQETLDALRALRDPGS